jgi:hypothetical protein
VVDPDLKSAPIELSQTAPGRYEGTIERAEASGNYFVNLGYRGPDGVQGVVSSGVSVPYSDEYRELRSNPTTLETLASLTDGQFSTWEAFPDGRIDLARTVSERDHFRRDPELVIPKSYAALWPMLLWMAACLFLGDVAVRRIAPDIARMRRTLASQWQRLRGQEPAPQSEYMEKLRTRKAEVGEQLSRTQAVSSSLRDSRSESGQVSGAAAAAASEPLLAGREPGGAGSAARRPGSSPVAGMTPEAQAQPESYTNRLLKAKQKVWEDREKEQDQEKKPKIPGDPNRPSGGT